MQAVADKDKDERVSLDEFLASYDATLSDKAAFERNIVGYSTTIFQLCDRDGDGKISGPEFVGLGGCYGLTHEAVLEAFRHLDQDGTGLLTTEELVKRYREFLSDDPDAPGNWLMGPY